MPVGKKLAIVMSVVICGASVAFLFRKDAFSLRFWQSSDDPFAHRVERRITTDVAWTGRDQQKKTEPRRVPAATAAIAEPKGLAEDETPTFRNNLNPVGSLLPPIEGIVTDADEADLAAADLNFAPPAETPSRHVVVDGDTLSTLAVRYLGRADAYLEIYEANRDVLDNPDLLPIGAVLRIPQSSSGSAARARLAPQSPAGLVPVLRRPG